MLKNQAVPSNGARSQANPDQLMSEVFALRETAKALEVGLEAKRPDRTVRNPNRERQGTIGKSPG